MLILFIAVSTWFFSTLNAEKINHNIACFTTGPDNPLRTSQKASSIAQYLSNNKKYVSISNGPALELELGVSLFF